MNAEDSMSVKSLAIVARAEDRTVCHSLQRQTRNCMTYVQEKGGMVVSVHAECSNGGELSQRPQSQALPTFSDRGLITSPAKALIGFADPPPTIQFFAVTLTKKGAKRDGRREVGSSLRREYCGDHLRAFSGRLSHSN